MKIAVFPVECVADSAFLSAVDTNGVRMLGLVFRYLRKHGFCGEETMPIPIPILHPGDRVASDHAHELQRLIHRQLDNGLAIPYKESWLGGGEVGCLAERVHYLTQKHFMATLMVVIAPTPLLPDIARIFGMSPAPAEAQMGWLGHVDTTQDTSEWIDCRPPPIIFPAPPPIVWDEPDPDSDTSALAK